MNKQHQEIAIIAPTQLLNGFQILVKSAPNLNLIAADVSLEALQKKIGKKIPDSILMYLAAEHLRRYYEYVSVEEIKKLKKIWPEVNCIVVVRDAHQRDRARAMGADVVLFEGITPSRLISAIYKLNPKIDKGSNTEDVNASK